MLKPKVLIDPSKKLYPEYYNYLEMFSYILTEYLSPYYPGIDYKIPLEKTSNGKKPEVP